MEAGRALQGGVERNGAEPHSVRRRGVPTSTPRPASVDYSMDEATLSVVLKSVINGKKLTKVEDAAKLHVTTERHQGKLRNFEDKLAKLERRLELVEGTATSPPQKSTRSRTITGSRASAASSAGDTNSWRPRLVHVKGFAEHGRPSSHKARKGQMEQIQATLLRSVPKHISECLAPMGGFALNHQVSIRVVEKDPGAIRSGSTKSSEVGKAATRTTLRRSGEQHLEEPEKEQGEAVRVDVEAADDADADADADKDI